MPVNHEDPIKIYPDGSFWCALWGKDLQSGQSGFGRSPFDALSSLMKNDEVWEQSPHGVWDLTCPNCGHRAVHVMPYPFPSDSVECDKCKADIPVSSEPDTLPEATADNAEAGIVDDDF
jgi:hypothetical protein